MHRRKKKKTFIHTYTQLLLLPQTIICAGSPHTAIDNQPKKRQKKKPQTNNNNNNNNRRRASRFNLGDIRLGHNRAGNR